MCVAFRWSATQGYNTVSSEKSEEEEKNLKISCFRRKINCPITVRTMVCLKICTSCMRFLRKTGYVQFVLITWWMESLML